MIPIVISIVMGHSAEGLNPLGVTIACNMQFRFGLVLPVNSPQGMVAYGTDTFDVKTFMTTGIPLTIIGYVMMLICPNILALDRNYLSLNILNRPNILDNSNILN